MGTATLAKVYEEVRRIEKRLNFIKDLLEEIIVRELPKEKLTEREVEGIKKISQGDGEGQIRHFKGAGKCLGLKSLRIEGSKVSERV